MLNLLSGVGGHEEFFIDREGTLLDGRSEVPTSGRGIIGIKSGECVE